MGRSKIMGFIQDEMDGGVVGGGGYMGTGMAFLVLYIT